VFSVSTSFDLHRGRIERMLRLPGGMVWNNMERRVRRVEAEAIRRAPGGMKARIRAQIRRTGTGDFQGVIKVDHPAALYVLNGTRPHRIVPRTKKALRFTVGGQVVFATVVHHPGNKQNNFLKEALRAAL
jgi:hypothetical protein